MDVVKKIKPIHLSIVLSFILIGWFLLTNPKTAEDTSLNERPVRDRVVTLNSIEIQDYPVEQRTLYYTRYVRTEPSVQQLISSEVSGRIKELLVNNGDFVQKDDVVAIIDSSVMKAEEASLQASVNEKRSLHQAQVRLRSQGHINERAVEQSLFELKKAEADLKRVQDTINKHTLLSLADGYVSHLDYKVNDLINSFQPIMHINDLSGFKVYTYIPESYLPLLYIGKKATIETNQQLKEMNLHSINRVSDDQRPLFKTEWISDSSVEFTGVSSTLRIPLKEITSIKISPYILTIEDNALGIKHITDVENNGKKVNFIPIDIADTFPDNDVLVELPHYEQSSINIITLGSDRVRSGMIIY